MASVWGAPAPQGLICETLFATPFTAPFPHIYGGCDMAVLKGRAKRTIELNSSSKRIESHIGDVHRRICIIYRISCVLLRFAVYLALAFSRPFVLN
jgi:hypothetical protein